MSTRISDLPAEYQRQAREQMGPDEARPAGRRPKYGNVKVQADGHTFDSKKEYARWGVLKLLQAAGQIEGLRPHVTFALDVEGVHICDYIADFVYRNHGSEVLIVEDVKSPATRTAVYRLKKKLMLACWGIDILET